MIFEDMEFSTDILVSVPWTRMYVLVPTDPVLFIGAQPCDRISVLHTPGERDIPYEDTGLDGQSRFAPEDRGAAPLFC